MGGGRRGCWEVFISVRIGDGDGDGVVVDVAATSMGIRRWMGSGNFVSSLCILMVACPEY